MYVSFAYESRAFVDWRGQYAGHARHDGPSDPGAGDSGGPGHHPLSGARPGPVSVVDQGRPLRAKAMASLTGAMVTDAAGHVAEVLHVPGRARKGTTSGHTMPLYPDLEAALVSLQTARIDMATPARPILFSEVRALHGMLLRENPT